jgi:hypothetical protein
MPRGIRAVGRKGSVFGNADIFVGRDRGRFGFRASVRKEPAGKPARETARNVAARRSSCRCGSAQVAGRARSCFFDFWLWLVRFLLDNWRNGRSQRLATVLG